ncbi:MAG: hypothetical protein ACRC62_08710 [Microcoleus sp.]
MGQCTTLKTGEDLELYISDTNASCEFYTLPTAAGARAWNIPSGATAAAAGANTVPLGTIPAALTNLFIPSGMYLGFIVGGIEVPVQLTANVTNASTSLSVEDLPLAIPSGSLFRWPVLVGGVTNLTVNNNQNIVTGESGVDGFAPSGVGLASGSWDIAMEEDPTNAGQLNIERFQSLGETCVLSAYDPEFRTFLKRKFSRALGLFGTVSEAKPRNTQLTKTANFTLTRRAEKTIGVAA